MDAAKDKLLATLTNLLSLHVLLCQLVVGLDSVHVLTEVAQEVVEEVVKGLQKVAVIVISNVLQNNATLRDPLLDLSAF